MTGNTKKMISMTEANRNFSKAVKIANADGSVFIMQDNKPEYILLKINNNENTKLLMIKNLMLFPDNYLNRIKKGTNCLQNKRNDESSL